MDIRPIDANALLEKIRFREGPFMGQREIFLIEGEPTLSLNTLRDEVYQDAVAHGLYENEKYNRAHPFGVMYTCRNLACRIKDEVNELITSTYQQTMEHFAEELADIIIICLSVAGHLGIDIDAAVKRKVEINKQRSWKHEGEK